MKRSAAPSMSNKHKRLKRALEALLKKHGFRRDDRPDHREWMKYAAAYHFKIRLDQNNPEGFNGFQFTLTSLLRWDPAPGDLEAVLRFLKTEFP